jgi:hypothetical protein
MWWMVGGVLIAAAAVRWLTGRNGADAPLDRADQVARAYAAARYGRPVAIASASEGPVVFRGKVSAAGAPFVTRLSEQPCVVSDLRVDDLERQEPTPEFKDSKPQSITVLRERQAQPFLITDETGTAEVRIDDVADVSFVLAPHLSLKGRRLRASAGVANTLFKLGLAPQGALLVTEAAVFVGDTVTVAGVGRRELSPGVPTAGFRQVPMRFVVRGGTNDVMAIVKTRS